ncbi:MAG: ParB/RepB/Spo0J family partition protein [Sedimentisphaerales bacterium]|jgi:ParB-like chromosome segregation protein Spo0J
MKNVEVKSEGKIKSIALSKLLAHPDNPNVMSKATFRKLVRNIERTGLYEPIIVRPHPNKKDHSATADKFQIINGHHRVKAIEQLGHKEADCVVWDVDDEQTNILLTTLNRLAGSDTPSKKIELLKKLTERMGTAQLAKLLPQTAKQIERLTNLKLAIAPIKAQAEQFAIPIVFFVTKQQQGVIENALSTIENRISPERDTLRWSNEMTKAQRRAAAITEIAGQFMGGEKCRM